MAGESSCHGKNCHPFQSWLVFHFWAWNKKEDEPVKGWLFTNWFFLLLIKSGKSSFQLFWSITVNIRRAQNTSGLANFQFRDSQFLKVKWRLSDKERITVIIGILFVVMGNNFELCFLGNLNVALIFFLQEKKLKVFQKLDNFYKYRLFCRPFVWSSAACLHTHLLGNKNERGFVSNGSFRVLHRNSRQTFQTNTK